jgi:hypothetical protein
MHRRQAIPDTTVHTSRYSKRNMLLQFVSSVIHSPAVSTPYCCILLYTAASHSTFHVTDFLYLYLKESDWRTSFVYTSYTCVFDTLNVTLCSLHRHEWLHFHYIPYTRLVSKPITVAAKAGATRAHEVRPLQRTYFMTDVAEDTVAECGA